MKKLITILLAFAISVMAYVADNTMSSKELRIYMRSGNWNTGDRYTTVPVIVNGKVTCPYVGSIFADPLEDGRCPAVNVYHLVHVTREKKGLSCFYDYTVGGGYMFVFYKQQHCPDILASFDGMQLFREVYFDDVDDYRLYYQDTLLVQSFEGDFDDYPRVKEQIRYRRIHMRKDKRNIKPIVFGEN